MPHQRPGGLCPRLLSVLWVLLSPLRIIYFPSKKCLQSPLPFFSLTANLTQEEIRNLNRSILLSAMENLPTTTKKPPGPDGCTG
jgi:hypothetical protein